MSDDAAAVAKPTSLDSLSDECIDFLTRYWDYYDIRALELCGNHSLSARIERSVSKVRVVVPSLGEWPLHAFNYRNLRSLEVYHAGSGPKYKKTAPILVKDDLLIPKEGHKSLDSLTIHMSLSFSILYALSPSLQELLPLLRTLDLEGAGVFKPLKLFKNLPSTLTHLRLKPTGEGAHVLSSIPASLIEMLPRSLETLMLENCDIALDKGLATDPSQLSFPPGLTHLRFTTTHLQPAIQAIPKSVTNLKLRKTHLAGRQQLVVSSLRRLHLKRFGFSCSSASMTVDLVLDMPFPPTLTSISLPTRFKEFVDEGAITTKPRLDRYFPPSLTSFKGLYSVHDLINWGVTLPNLRYGQIWRSVFEGDAPRKIPPLVMMSLEGVHLADVMIRALPITLESLSATVFNTPVWMEKFETLKSLTYLELGHHGPVLPSIGFWDLMRERLTDLRCCTYNFESLGDMCTDWTKLRSLSLYCTADERSGPADYKQCTFDPSNTDLKLLRLPASLEVLYLAIGNNCAFFGHSLGYLTKLKNFTLGTFGTEYTSSAADTEGHTPFFMFAKNLPPSLTHASIDTPTPLPVEYMGFLPKSLRDLSLSSRQSSRDTILWTEEHFRRLPPKLAFLSVARPLKNSDNYKSSLPPTLSHGIVEFGRDPSPDRTPAMRELRRQKNAFSDA